MSAPVPAVAARTRDTTLWQLSKLGPAGAGLATHRSDRAFPLGIQRLSHPEGGGPYYEPRVRRDPGGGPLLAADPPPPRALADRLQVPQGRRLGVVLPLDRPG